MPIYFGLARPLMSKKLSRMVSMSGNTTAMPNSTITGAISSQAAGQSPSRQPPLALGAASSFRRSLPLGETSLAVAPLALSATVSCISRRPPPWLRSRR